MILTPKLYFGQCNHDFASPLKGRRLKWMLKKSLIVSFFASLSNDNRSFSAACEARATWRELWVAPKCLAW
jgi:hypothetical protein